MRIRPLLLALTLLALTGCASSNARYYNDGYAGACGNCGTVDRIERVYGERDTTGGGAVVGAIIGGVLGNQVGSGSGRKAATVAGAVAGGGIGNNVEKNERSAPRFEIFVIMDDGRRLVVEQKELGYLRDGDRVQLVNGRVVRF